jgi:hypothetical protein
MVFPQTVELRCQPVQCVACLRIALRKANTLQSRALGAIMTSVAQQPGIYTKVQIHGSNGASVGVQTDTGATFVAGVSGIAQPPFNDVWTIPCEEQLLPQFQAKDRARFQQVDGTTHYHTLQIQDFRQAILEHPNNRLSRSALCVSIATCSKSCQPRGGQDR